MRKLLLVLILFASPMTWASECQDFAYFVTQIKVAHERDVSKSVLLETFNGNDAEGRAIRDIIVSVYRGDFDNVTETHMYDTMLSLCQSRK